MTVQEALALRVRTLTDQQARVLMDLIEVMQPAVPPDNPDYDESRDPAIGLFTGPPDLASPDT